MTPHTTRVKFQNGETMVDKTIPTSEIVPTKTKVFF
jgi:hypothetical protein